MRSNVQPAANATEKGAHTTDRSVLSSPLESTPHLNHVASRSDIVESGPPRRLRGRKERASMLIPTIVLLVCFVFDASTLLPLNLYGGASDLGGALRNFTTSVADLWIWLFVRVVVAMGTVGISLVVFNAASSAKQSSVHVDNATGERAPLLATSSQTQSGGLDDHTEPSPPPPPPGSEGLTNGERTNASHCMPVSGGGAGGEVSIVAHSPLSPTHDGFRDVGRVHSEGHIEPHTDLPLYKNIPLLKARDKLRISQGRVRLGLLCVMFFLHMGCNVYVAVKAMRFSVYNENEYGLGIRLNRLGLAAAMLCLHVLSCSIELFVTSSLLSRASIRNSYILATDGSWLDDHDVECPLLHPHPLKYISRTVMSSCNVCSTRFRVSDRKFTCEICDFNTCSQCLETKMEQYSTALKQEAERASTSGGGVVSCDADNASIAATQGSAGAGAGGGDGDTKPSVASSPLLKSPLSAPGPSLGMLNTDGFLTAASDKTVISIGRWAYAKRIAIIANQFRGVLFIGLACLVVAQAVNIILPKYQGNVVDAVVKKDSDLVRTDIEWYVGLGLARLLFSSIRTYCTMMTSQYATNTVRIMLFSALTQRSVAFFDATSTGALQSRLSSDSTQMVSPLSTLFNDTISNILVLIGATIMAFIVSWKLALLSFTVLGPIVYLTSSYAQVSRRLVRQIRDSVAEGGAISNQVLTSIRTVKGFANEEYEVERYSGALLQAVSIAIKNAAAAVAIGLATSVMDVGIMALTLSFGSYLILNYPDELSIGELITFQLYANMMNSSYRAINNSLNELTKSAGAAERVLALMDVPPTPENEESSNYALLAKNGKKFGASPCFSIRFENVHFRYPNRPINPVLKGLSFVCQPGKVTALVGPSGSGKSTVVQILQRFYGCNAGRIKIGLLENSTAPALIADDVAEYWGHHSPVPLGMARQISSGGQYELIGEIPLNEIARVDWLSDVAVVSQDTQLFSSTVFENITYGIANTRAFDSVEEKPVGAHSAAGGGGGGGGAKSGKLLRAAKEASEWQRRHNGGANQTHTRVLINDDIQGGGNKERVTSGDREDAEDEPANKPPAIKSVVSLEDVIAAAKKAQAHDFIMKLPEGYYTPIGERGCTLSGGQRQRLAIARALLRKPKLLLLDEATSALDNESEALVQKAIDDLLAAERESDRCTVLVIAHRLTTIQNADNIVVLQDGVVLEEGTHTQLASAGGLYQSFLASGFPKSETVDRQASVHGKGKGKGRGRGETNGARE